MAAQSIKIGLAVLLGTVLFIPVAVQASHGDGRPCMGRWPTLFASDEDVVRGTEGDDVILGTSGPDTIMGLGGTDIICGADGNDNVYAGEGDDRVLGEGGDDRLVGGHGVDLLYGGVGNDVVVGQDGNDIVRGGPDGGPTTDRDLVSGGAGDDLLLNGSAVDSFVGEDGDDSFAFRAGVALVDLSWGVVVSDTDVVDSIAGVENVLGFAQIPGDDPGRPVDPIIRGDANGNILVGGEASDHIFGLEGNDLVDGYCGSDHLDGGPGAEDVASFRFQNAVTANLESGLATAEWQPCGAAGRSVAVLTEVEGLAGGVGDDVLSGDAGDNYIYGAAGFDVLAGLSGADVLDGSTDGGMLLGGDGLDRCVNGESDWACETGFGSFGPRRPGSVHLLQRFARVLEMVELAQRLVSV